MSTMTPVRLRPVSASRRVTFFDGGNTADTNAAAAAHFIGGIQSAQNQADLRHMRECRLVVLRRPAAAAAGYTIELKYLAAYSSTPADFATIGREAVSVNAVDANTMYETGWVRLLSAARGDVVVVPIASGGNGSASPNVGLVYAEFR